RGESPIQAISSRSRMRGFMRSMPENRCADIGDGLFIVALTKIAGAQDPLIAPENILSLERVAVRVSAGLDTDLRHFTEEEGFAGHIAANLSSEVSHHLGEGR